MLVLKRTQCWELKLLVSDDLKLKKHELDLESFFKCCSSLTGRFPKFVVFMIISAEILDLFYPLWNLKEYKRSHQRVKTDKTFMKMELINMNGRIFSFTILCINFIILDWPLVSLEHSTL